VRERDGERERVSERERHTYTTTFHYQSSIIVMTS